MFFLFINFKNLQSNDYVRSQDHVICEEGGVMIVNLFKDAFGVHTISFKWWLQGIHLVINHGDEYLF